MGRVLSIACRVYLWPHSPMLRSMTGFGRAEGVVKDRKVTVEVRSLNSKQLDLLVRVPMPYKEHEAGLRQWVGEEVVRGKAEVFVTAEPLQAVQRSTFDRERVRAYYAELKELAREVAPEATTDLFAHVLRMPEVVRGQEESAGAEEWNGVSALVRKAVAAFITFRSNEGTRLMEALKGHVERISALLSEAESMDQGRIERTRERLRAKLAELAIKVDEDRFEQELVFYLEKLDITEEKVRLRGHCAYFHETMQGTGEHGRKLGFIAQEMGREINTLGSKANDAAIQRVVVMMKEELEKVKEQVLNVL